MKQIYASFTKTLKQFFRVRSVLFWSVAWPVLLLVLINTASLNNVAAADLPVARAYITISMIVFALMMSGMSNLAGSIARDRETGLLVKLRSMPVSPWSDFAGRFLAMVAFAGLVTFIIVQVGSGIGAPFGGGSTGELEAAAFLALAIIACGGIGLIIGSVVKNTQGAITTGSALAVITSFISGIFVPYDALPSFLQSFARIYPISSAGASASYALLGADVTGYNPLTTAQIATTVVLSLALIGVGTYLYSKGSWKKD